MKKIISVAVALCIAITSLFTSVYAMADSKVTSGDIKKEAQRYGNLSFI